MISPAANGFKNSPSAARWFALSIAVALTLLGGALYGSYSQRWNRPEQLLDAAAQLVEMPRQIGDWKAVEDVPFDDATRQMLDCSGSVNRRYVNRKTGRSIQCAVIVGRPGPIAVHTPEICYSSRDYEIQNQRVATGIDADPNHKHTFWRTDFSSRNALADGLHVYYAWSTGTTWTAAKSPRFEFGGVPLLYKLQLATQVTPNSAHGGPDAGQQFLEDFVKSAWPPILPVKQ